LRTALLGAGTIARLVLDHIRRGELPGVQVVAVTGRSGSARTQALGRELDMAVVVGREALLAARPEAVLEGGLPRGGPRVSGASAGFRDKKVALLSAGALDDVLRGAAERSDTAPDQANP
jgi:predicted dinucleotide-utilizing enzyme